MIDSATLARVVTRANLAPSVHNTQPARWRQDGGVITVAADLSVGLKVGDPTGQDAGLSCGAAVEATCLALGDLGWGASVTDLWQAKDRESWPGHRMAARLEIKEGRPDPLAAALEQRFTWRGAFGAGGVPPDWQRNDCVMVTEDTDRAWLAARNDVASLGILRDALFRGELVQWMRLSDRHPRVAFDGLSRAALGLKWWEAPVAGLALGPLWPLLDRLRLTGALTAEAAATRSAPVIACFFRPQGESPVTSGRAYLRLCLEAAARGFAGWPMAALADDPQTAAKVSARFAVPAGHRLVQVIRFGPPRGTAPPRARRPLAEVAP